MADLRIVGFNTGVNHVAKTGNQQHRAETTGALANNHQNDPVFKKQNAETAGAIAFGQQDSTAQAGHQFMAMA